MGGWDRDREKGGAWYSKKMLPSRSNLGNDREDEGAFAGAVLGDGSKGDTEIDQFIALHCIAFTNPVAWKMGKVQTTGMKATAEEHIASCKKYDCRRKD